MSATLQMKQLACTRGLTEMGSMRQTLPLKGVELENSFQDNLRSLLSGCGFEKVKRIRCGSYKYMRQISKLRRNILFESYTEVDSLSKPLYKQP